MRPPSPRDAFPHLIETARLRLHKPERRQQSTYAQFAAVTLSPAEPPSEVKGEAFAAFMIEHWDRYGFGFLVAEVVENPGPPVTIGHAGFKYVDAWPDHWPENYEAIELGYALVPAARGRGYATEAARAVLLAAFAAFDVASIRARCNVENVKSAAVLLRCGMTELEATDTRRRFEIARPA